MAIKKVLVQKKIEGVIYDIYQKTSADVVVYEHLNLAKSPVALNIKAFIFTPQSFLNILNIKFFW